MDRPLLCRTVAFLFLVLAPRVMALEEAELALFSELKDELASRVEKDKSSTWEITAPAPSLQIREDYQAKLAELNDASNGAEFLRHGIEYLTRFDPADDFAEKLWRSAAYSELAERSGDPVLQTKLTPFLISLLARLPESDEFYLEGRFLAATHHNHQQEYAEEEEILRRILARDELKRDFRFSAIERMGLNLELRQRHLEALAWYLKAEEYLGEFPSACDALLRAVFIYLESDRRDDAMALAEKFRALERGKWSKAPCATQIGALLALTEDRAKANAYWDASAVWWESWTGLRRELGYRAGDPDIRVPLIPNVRQLDQQMGMAVRAGQSALFLNALDLLSRALRWLPDYANEVGSAICFLGVRQFPGQAEALRHHMLRICDHFETDDADLRRYLTLYRTLCLIDLGETDKALEIILKFRESDNRDDPISQGITRLWAAVAYARGEGMDEPAEALARMLRDPEAINRVQTVLSLSSLYRKMGRTDDEQQLLEAELERPEVEANPVVRKVLEDRYHPIVREGKDVANFSVAVGDWLTKFKPEWFDLCPPLDLGDPRVADLETVLREGGAFTDEEMIKLRLLAANAPGVPLVLKQLGFRRAMAELAIGVPTHREFRRRVTEVIDNDLFPEELRKATLLFGIEQAVEHRQPGDLAFYLTHPVMDQQDERIRAAMEIYGPYSQCDPMSPDDLFAFHKQLSKGVIDRPHLAVLFSIFSRLLDLGAVDKADAMYESAGTWALAPSVEQSTNEVKLMLLRTLKQARRSIPFSDAMVALVRAHFDLDAVTEPAEFSTLRDLRNLDRLPRAKMEQVRLWQIKTGDFPRTDPRFCLDFAGALPQSENSFAFAFEMLEKLLAEAGGDLEKSLGALAAPGFIDTDEPKLVDRLTKIFAPYRDATKYPLTYSAIRFLEIQTSLRRGEDIDLAGALDGVEHPALTRTLARLEIRHYLVSGKIPLLRTLLETLPADDLMNPGMLPLTIPAFDAAGLADEAELARETARERFAVILASAWRSMNIGDVSAVCELARLIGAPERVPAEFFNSIDAALGNEQTSLSLRLHQADLNKDWKSMERFATDAIALFPTFYHFYWYQAKARQELGRPAEALAPLEIYTKYSKDEEEYPTALEWLRQIKATPRTEEKPGE